MQLYRADGDHVYARSQFILPSRALPGSLRSGMARSMLIRRVSAKWRRVCSRLPTVTVINMADVLEVVRKVVDQIAMILRFVAGFVCWLGGIFWRRA